MYRILLSLVLIMFLVFINFTSETALGLYNWTDKDGIVHYTNDPANIPVSSKEEPKTPSSGNELIKYNNEILELKKKLPSNLQNKYCFQDIVFGTSFDAVRYLLIHKYGDWRIYSNHPFILLRGFLLGDKAVDVSFYFDHEDKFYAFKFQSKKYSANYFDTSVIEEGKFLTDLFINKYGNPAKYFKPSFISIKSGYDAYLCKWDDKYLEIYTSLGTYEFEYYAESYVGSIVMSNNYGRAQKINNIKKVEKGASTF